jgi:tannase/feruloyl esterase
MWRKASWYRAVGLVALTGLLGILAPADARAEATALGSPSGGLPNQLVGQTMFTARDSACTMLREFRMPDVRLTEVVDAPDSLAHGDNVRAPHCRVSGFIGGEIAFTVMLPRQWNQRLLMGGNGGFAGTINRGVLANATNGYVAVSTNTGHDESPGGGARWALNNPERQVNYGFAAVHRTVEVAKVLARAFYGNEPRFSYFNGCSNGGRQGLMEIERYPDDFDGVISGAPAAQFSKIFVSFFKNVRAAFPTPASFDHPLITQANLDLVASKVLDACDTLDGVHDGIVDDPRTCSFRLATVRACSSNRAGPDCLTTAQRSAIARIYAPTTDAKGRITYPGQPVGGENLAGGWSIWIVGRDTGLMRELHVPSLQAMFLTEGAKYVVFSDSTWDYSRYQGNLASEMGRLANIGDADDPNISRFMARKGKLILYHGWADPALNPLATIDYYTKVLQANPAARDQVRLFMMPGVLHCAGGPGPSDAPWLRTMVDWVEQGVAPERVVATKREGGKVTRSRPLCAYPKRASYVGAGSTDDANSFRCGDGK